MDNLDNNMTINDLREIRLRKKKVLSLIKKDNDNMSQMWKSLFQKKNKSKKKLTISSVLTAGTGVLDGLLLTWKLYRKFKK